MTVIIDYGVGNLFSLQSSLASIGAQAKVSADPAEILAADRIILPGVGAFADAAEKLRQSGLVETLVRAKDEGVPIMGICLGMQLLFEKSYEYGCHEGLGFLKGDIVAITDVLAGAPSISAADPRISAGGTLKIPHMGWNGLKFAAADGSAKSDGSAKAGGAAKSDGSAKAGGAAKSDGSAEAGGSAKSDGSAEAKHPLFKYISDGDFVYFVHSYCAVNTDALIASTEYGADLTAAVAKGNVMGCQFHPEKSGETGLKILRAFCELERSTTC